MAKDITNNNISMQLWDALFCPLKTLLDKRRLCVKNRDTPLLNWMNYVSFAFIPLVLEAVFTDSRPLMKPLPIMHPMFLKVQRSQTYPLHKHVIQQIVNFLYFSKISMCKLGLAKLLNVSQFSLNFFVKWVDLSDELESVCFPKSASDWRLS